MTCTKYKIEETRYDNKQSRFVLKRKILFWWEKVPLYPYNYMDRYSFSKLRVAIAYVDDYNGSIISIENTKTKKKK